MNKIAFILALALIAPFAAQAQTNKFEVFAGYSFQRVEGFPSNANMSGWEGALTYKFTPYLGVTADVSGQYGTLTGSRINYHNILVGPELSLPRKLSPFVHVLVGDGRSSVFGVTSKTFAVAIGGGVDYRLTNLLSARLAQFDVITGATRQTSSDGRFSAGIVFHF
ncbi:MAG TPA: outer membrane beta-barrel protein [Candidatus Acidoferrales bacterium]|nr:outer membrane beta-barrel protein [Candidatus Acidoferrales bacterium]